MYLSIYLSVYLSLLIYLHTYSLTYLPTYMCFLSDRTLYAVHPHSLIRFLSIHLLSYTHTHVSTYPFTYLPNYLPVYIFVNPNPLFYRTLYAVHPHST